ncbi:hypothetical protein [Deinococcus multiflagellatus]|uniref:Uncharacterized protein n=1 Tax=Deinococcus multiflagellatus TaxID=1656887 RepID=A0ABW1ZTQ3_9DEIO|nr:hypothetical protein [Deinococcus multiflagellatus]MBZ9714440.1 hypothetical protein [Deinococcus multiflagellatus]
MSSNFLPVPKFKGSIAKMGLDSREDFMTTLVVAGALYFLLKSLIPHPLAPLIAMAIAGLVWKFVIVDLVRAYRKRYPPKYPMHWLRSRVILAPILHPRPDPQPLPLSVRDQNP